MRWYVVAMATNNRLRRMSGGLLQWRRPASADFRQEYLRVLKLHLGRYPAREPVLYSLHAAVLFPTKKLANLSWSAEGFNECFVVHGKH